MWTPPAENDRWYYAEAIMLVSSWHIFWMAAKSMGVTGDCCCSAFDTGIEPSARCQALAYFILSVLSSRSRYLLVDQFKCLAIHISAIPSGLIIHCITDPCEVCWESLRLIYVPMRLWIRYLLLDILSLQTRKIISATFCHTFWCGAEN